MHEAMFSILSHKGMQIQTALTFHLTPVRLAVIKKTTNAGKDAKEKRNS
jgi:hypothetical protein